MNYENNYDICGWAAIDNMVAKNETVVKPGAFTKQDGTKVPIILENDLNNPVGAAVLKSVDGGMYFYGTLIEPMLEKIHAGEIQTVSIYADNILLDNKRDVIYGTIRALELPPYDVQPPEYQDTKIEKWKHNEKMYTRDENGLHEI